MAVNNRDEAKVRVDTVIVPKVNNVNHRGLLNDDILSSIIFRKDVILSETPAGGSVTIDYDNKDLASFTTAVNITISFTNIANGDVKYIALTKNAGNTVSFSGAFDTSPRRAYIDSTITYVVYEVANKNGNIYVRSKSVDDDENVEGLTGGVSKVLDTYTGWDMDTASSIIMPWPSGVSLANFVSAEVTIENNFGAKYPLMFGVFAPATFGGNYEAELAGLTLYRGTTGGLFDSPNFNSANVQAFIKYIA
jgi:hypothetical protein